MPITPRHKPNHPVIEFLDNVRLGAQVAVELLHMGACVYCPGNDFIYWLATDGPEDTLIYESDLDTISYCCGVVGIPGWESSPNCQKEMAYARRLGKNIFQWPEDKQDIANFIAKFRRLYKDE